jgi:hypothetical protein
MARLEKPKINPNFQIKSIGCNQPKPAAMKKIGAAQRKYLRIEFVVKC